MEPETGVMLQQAKECEDLLAPPEATQLSYRREIVFPSDPAGRSNPTRSLTLDL